MTENEKAATFIGWKPDDCHCALKPGAHGHFCPDMSRPENYMRALETDAIRNRGDWRIQYLTARAELPAHFSCYINYQTRYSRQRYKSNHYVCDAQGRGATVGQAIIAALAALYDQEHPNG